MSDQKFKIDIHYGYVDSLQWFQIDEITDKGVIVKGMGCLKKFDREGNLLSCEISPTGVTMIIPLVDNRKPSFWKRLFG